MCESFEFCAGVVNVDENNKIQMEMKKDTSKLTGQSMKECILQEMERSMMMTDIFGF